MSAPDYISNNPNLKRLYDTYAVMLLTLRPGLLAAADKLGKKTAALVGGDSWNFAIQTDYAAAAGFGSSTNSIAYLGNNNVPTKQGAITTSYLYSRAEIDTRRQLQSTLNGRLATFVDEAASKFRGCMEVTRAMMDIQYSNTGNGDAGTVTDTGSAITAGSSGSVAVDRVELFTKSAVYEIDRSGFSGATAGVLIRVDTMDAGTGPGTLTVTNVSASASYTPTAADIFSIAYGRSLEQMYLSGVKNGIGNQAYPNAGGQNRQITDPDFKSVVKNAAGARITFDMLWALKNDVEKQAASPDAFAPIMEHTTYKTLQTPHVFIISRDHVTALRKSLQPFQKWDNALPDTNQVWGQVTFLDGIPLLANDLSTPTDVYCYHAPSWEVHIPTVQPIIGQSGMWQRIPQTGNNETAYLTPIMTVTPNRKTQGVIYNVAGTSSSDLGLTNGTR